MTFFQAASPHSLITVVLGGPQPIFVRTCIWVSPVAGGFCPNLELAFGRFLANFCPNLHLAFIGIRGVLPPVGGQIETCKS